MSDSVTVGLGTYGLTDPARTVADAIGLGYTLIDTAASYSNEVEVGEGIARSGASRDSVRVTSKLRGGDQGADTVRPALIGSLERLGLDYLDLYLIHWPLPRLDLYVESWEAMIAAREEGLVREIGVSNFEPDHLDRVIAAGHTPSTNQIECNPYFVQAELREECAARGVGIQTYRPLGRGSDMLVDLTVAGLANELGITPAQVLLSWATTHGCTPIPKTDSRERLIENAAVVALEPDHMTELDSLNRERVGGDPRTHEEF